MLSISEVHFSWSCFLVSLVLYQISIPIKVAALTGAFHLISLFSAMVKLGIQILCLAWLLAVTVSWLRSLLLNWNRFTLKHFILFFSLWGYLSSFSQPDASFVTKMWKLIAAPQVLGSEPWEDMSYVSSCGWIKCFKNKKSSITRDSCWTF